MIKKLIALVAALMFGVAAFANFAPYFGVEQGFFGPLDVYGGFESSWGDSVLAFEMSFYDILEVVDETGLGFGLYYDWDADRADFDFDFGIVWGEIGEWEPDMFNVLGRVDVIVLPGGCADPDPCYNPDLIFFVEAGVDWEPGHDPEAFGSVGAEIRW